jgi:signal transduction histidine kinase
MKTQTKIAAIFFFISLSIILLLSVTVYFFSTKYSFSDFYERLEIRAVLAAKSVLEHEEINMKAFKEVRDLHLQKLPQEKDYFIEIDSKKNFESASKELGLPLLFFTEVLEEGSAHYKSGNTFFSGIKYHNKEKKYLVIVSAENYYKTHYLGYFRNIFFIAIPLVSVVALLISVLFSRKVFSPVKKITNNVKEISAENIHLRLPERSGGDEISELIVTFNYMLDRLETAFATQNNFIGNASHELYSPLTTIIGEVDVALNKTRTPEEYVETLKTVSCEAERLNKIIRSLLFLAQTGFEGEKQKMEAVRMDELLWEVKELVDKLNPKNKVYIDLSLIPENPSKLNIKGNSQLLSLAITNLVNNACKYSDNKPVSLSIATSYDNIILVIRDSGIGIPEAEKKYIFDLFFRASNTKYHEGYGIGLRLAKNIIKLHNGSMKIWSKINEGTTVQLTFPLGKYQMA